MPVGCHGLFCLFIGCRENVGCRVSKPVSSGIDLTSGYVHAPGSKCRTSDRRDLGDAPQIRRSTNGGQPDWRCRCGELRFDLRAPMPGDRKTRRTLHASGILRVLFKRVGDAHKFLLCTSRTYLVMRRRGRLCFNYGAARRRIHRLVLHRDIPAWGKCVERDI